MKQVVLHIVCEGQTEERFVKKVLAPYLKNNNKDHKVIAKPILVTTNKSKKAQGGVVNFSHIERDIRNTLRQFPCNDYEEHHVTSFIDFYHLPNEFPGYEKAHLLSPIQGVEHMEEEFRKSIGDRRFFAYIQMHEFETLVLCGYEHLAKYYEDIDSEKFRGLRTKLRKEFESEENPEMINGGVTTAPSKRLIKIIKEYNQKYNKPTMGTYVTSCIGIDSLRKLCPHFNQWIEQILELPSTTH